MLRSLAKWIIRFIDFDIILVGDVLHIKLMIGAKIVFEKRFDLIPDNRVSDLFNNKEVRVNAKKA